MTLDHQSASGDDADAATQIVGQREPGEPQAERATMPLAFGPAQWWSLVAAAGCVLWTSTPDSSGDRSVWRALIGEVEATALGWEWLEVVHPDDRARVRQTWANALATSTAFSLTIRLRPHNDTYQTMRIVGAPVRGDDGATREWIGACFDWIDHDEFAQEQGRLLDLERRARDEAQATEARLRAVLDVLPYGVVIADADGKLIMLNKALVALWGDAAPLGGGISTYDSFRAWWPETGRPLSSEDWGLARALRQRKPFLGEEVDIETFDGERRAILNSAAPLYDTAGEFIGGVAVNVDITDRKRLEAELARRVSELEGVFAAITDALFVYDVDGRLIRTNLAARNLLGMPERIDPDYLDLPERDRVRRNNLRRSDGSPLPEDEWVVGRLMRGESLTAEGAVDVLVARPGAPEALVSFTGAPIRDDAGTIIGAVAVGRDITERSRLETQLREANAQLATLSAALSTQAQGLETTNRRMDQFVGMANHEMKTPLTSVGANLQLATRRLRRLARIAGEDASGHARRASIEQMSHDADAIIGIIERAQSAARRMTRLVDELLDVSRIQTGRLELRLEPCDLYTLIRGVIGDTRQRRSGRVIRLETDITSAPTVADSDRVSEVIDNYLSNAIKYSPADKPISVSLALTDDGAARVTVRDEGEGISPEMQSRIWNVFERLDSEATQRASGVNLGLGLHICKTIIELHGGQVGVESAVGAGSTFWFTLPLAVDPS